MCMDTETMGRGEVRPDDRAREQSGGEGPGDKLRAKGRQRRHRDEGQRRTKRGVENGEEIKWAEDSIFWIQGIDLMLKVHLAVTLPPHSPSDAFGKQQVMGMMSKVAVSCRYLRRWQTDVQLGDQKKRSAWWKEGAREGGRGKGRGRGRDKKKKQMSKGNEEGEKENKRGHWRQIKDTQLND